MIRDSKHERLRCSDSGSEKPAKSTRTPGDLKESRDFPGGPPDRAGQAKEKLKETEERFRSLLESLPHIVWEMDIPGKLTFVNRRAFEQFGYSREDFDRGLNAMQMISPKDRGRAMQNIQKLLTGEEVAVDEFEALRMDGTTFPVLIRATPILKDGTPLGLRGVIMDISDLKKAEAELRESEERFRTAFD
jgi:PAS domain S-box-containing protein